VLTTTAAAGDENTLASDLLVDFGARLSEMLRASSASKRSNMRRPPTPALELAKSVRDVHVRAAFHTVLHQLLTRGARIVDEVTLDYRGRIDILSIDDALHGYEIKAEADSLVRLPSQVSVFSASLERVTLVVDAKHVQPASALIPKWWGIITCQRWANGIRFKHVRKGRLNPRPRALSLLRLLWVSELQRLLQEASIPFGRRDTRARLSALYANAVPLATICTHVRETLRAREQWRGSHVA
jgi:hypothetical protein